MPRFVVLEHDHPFLHWDFMLETGNSLRTWRLLAPPDSEKPILAEPLPDHRLAYLDYEGPVSGGRGSVRQWDAGEFEWIRDSEHRCTFSLAGRRLTGKAELIVETAAPETNRAKGAPPAPTTTFRFQPHSERD